MRSDKARLVGGPVACGRPVRASAPSRLGPCGRGAVSMAMWPTPRAAPPGPTRGRPRACYTPTGRLRLAMVARLPRASQRALRSSSARFSSSDVACISEALLLVVGEQRAVFRDVAGHELLQHLGRELVGVRRDRRQIGEPLLHRVACDRGACGGVEPGDKFTITELEVGRGGVPGNAAAAF